MESEALLKGEVPNVLQVGRGPIKAAEINGVQEEYHRLYGEKGEDVRKDSYYSLTKSFYDMVTDFYEYGWGQSFHFAPRTRRETFDMSIARHEMHLALMIRMESGKTYLDTGCGIGGPQRQMATFVKGAHIVGLNIDTYQLERARMHTALARLGDQCSYKEGDFMKMPFDENTFDGGYNVESLCHAPDKIHCCKEVFRVMKPGALFASLEWATTPKFDANNPRHVQLTKDIMVGDALPDLPSFEEHENAWKAAGFEVVEARDLANSEPHMIPWYRTLEGQWTLQNFRQTSTGRWLTWCMLAVLEAVGLVPKGTGRVHDLLCLAADALAEAGRLDIFTPMYLVVVRKPE